MIELCTFFEGFSFEKFTENYRFVHAFVEICVVLLRNARIEVLKHF